MIIKKHVIKDLEDAGHDIFLLVGGRGRKKQQTNKHLR
jgi:hypothetical protein